jgi:hypothetical protein
MTKPYSNERDFVLEDIVSKIPQLSDPDQIEILVTTALQLMLRRTEDVDMRETLTHAVRNAIESVRTSSAREFADELHRTAINCVELLEAAQEERIPRDVIMHPLPGEAPSSDTMMSEADAANVNARPRITAYRLIMGFSALLVIASLAVIIARLVG